MHEKAVRSVDNLGGIQDRSTHGGIVTPNRSACSSVSAHLQAATFFHIQSTVHRDIFL